MKQDFPLDSVTLAEGHLAVCRRCIRRQVAVVRRLRKSGWDTDQAKALLRAYLHTQRVIREHRRTMLSLLA